MHSDLLKVLAAAGGVINRALLPRFRGQISWAVKTGEIVRVLPAIYARCGKAESLSVRVRAVMQADPDAVIVGRAAAVLHGLLHERECRAIEVASERLHTRGWLRVTRRRIPVELISTDDGVRVSSAALTVVDLIPVVGSAIVDTGLRCRIRLEDMKTALGAIPWRSGNRERAKVLARSASRPWSPAERVAHEALTAAGVRGWKANLAITSSAIADIAFEELKLVFEIDGRTYHGDERAFVRDRCRDAELAVRGWQVVRFAASDVFDDPARFAATVRRICQVRARQLCRQLT